MSPGRLLKNAGRTLLLVSLVLALFVQAMPTGVLAGHNGSTNNPPVIDPVGDQTVAEGTILHVEINATDADGDSLTWSAESLPPGSNFQQNSTNKAYFWWIPGYSQAGEHTVKYRVRDGDVATSGSFLVTVTDTNRAPKLEAVPNSWAYELTQFKLDMEASDPDGDDLTWSFRSIPTPDHNTTTLPAGVVLQNVGNYYAGLSWIPDCTQGLPGSPSTGGGARYEFEANLTDGQANASRRFNVTVYHVDAPAQLDTLTHKLALEGTTLSFGITATACDIEDHFLEVGTVAVATASVDPAPLPPGLPWTTELPLGVSVVPEDVSANQTVAMNYNATNKVYESIFTWDIGNNQAGNYTFYANITDAGNNTDFILFTIRIAENNTGPVWRLTGCADNTTCFGKEDTFLNMASPIGYTNATHLLDLGCHWNGTTILVGTGAAGMLPVACGTPMIFAVDDLENDRIFWNLEWLTKDGEAVTKNLPRGMTLISQGTNFSTGGGSNATMPAVPANLSAAFLNWIPGYGDAGTYGFRLWATDGLEETSVHFDIQVEKTNRRPVFDPIENLTVFEGETLWFEVTGKEYDFLRPVPSQRDDIALYMGNVSLGPGALPAGAEFHDAHDEQFATFRGAFSWTPGYHQAGVYDLEVFADDSGQTPMFPGNPHGFGDDTNLAVGDIQNPTNHPTPWENPGFGSKVAYEPWTELGAISAKFNITVVNVDRAPMLTAIDDVSFVGGASIYVPFAAYDPDFDPIVFNATGLPSFLTLTDNGDGTGYLSGTGTSGGAWDITVEACSSPLICDTESFRLVVIVDTAFDLKATQNTFKAAPGAPLTIPVKITNTGPAGSEIVNLALILADGTTGTIQATAPVAGGETVWANATITMAPDVDWTYVKIKGTSSIDGSYSRISTVRVDVPIFVESLMISTTPGAIQGQVNVTFLDGSPVVVEPITVIQSPTVNPLGLMSTNAKGTTHFDGTFVFKWAADRSASLPGEHKLTAEILYGGSTYKLDAGSYTV